jgi:hypothetical protein
MADEKPLIGWFCAGFFGLGIATSLLIMLLPNTIYLRLDESGFEVASLLTSYKVLWEEVDCFSITSIRGAKMIQIHHSDKYNQHKIAQAISSIVSGKEAAISDAYSAPLDEVLAALNSWKSRFGKQGD